MTEGGKPKPPPEDAAARMPFAGRDLDFEADCLRELEADVDEDWIKAQLGESKPESD